MHQNSEMNMSIIKLNSEYTSLINQLLLFSHRIYKEYSLIKIREIQ